MKGIILSILLLACCASLRAEPWIDTRDAHLRADIETLADIGLITVPITTYPLMWSGIVQNIDNTPIEKVSAQYRNVYWRVKKAGKQALAKSSSRQLRISGASGEQVLRAFGDDSRGKAEVSARSTGINKRFAWNIEVTRQHDAFDGDSTRYDGTYVAAVLDNWIVSAGAVDKWWGASWDSTSLLSNNARPPLGISVQRNYSAASENVFFSWLGPWTVNAFVAQLDDKRVIRNANLTGVSVNFKPLQSLEIAIRSTALWGGKQLIGYNQQTEQNDYRNRSQSFDSFIDNIIGNQVCDVVSPSQYACDESYSASGDRMAGIDLRWKFPLNYPISVYASAYGESETDFLPTKNIVQYGLTSSFQVLNSNWTWFAETTDTTLHSSEYNQAYESDVYQTGYRYHQRSIGSTYDNDSKVTSAGILGRVGRDNKFSLTFSDIKLNQDGQNALNSQHSITQASNKFKRIKLNWSYQTNSNGEFKLTIDHTDKVYDDFARLEDKTRFSIDWKYYLN